MKTIVIVLNGENLHAHRLPSVLHKADIIIAADGGANFCLRHDIRPHYIIGDLDSIRVEHEQLLPDSEVIRIDDQYSTDLQKAMKLAETLHGDRWLIINATGKRADHTLANLLFLADKAQTVNLQVIDNYGSLRFLAPGEHSFDLPIGTTVSLLAWQAVKNITLSGFRYPLRNRDFETFFVGISNVVSATPCTITFSQGLLVMYEAEQRV